MLQRFLYWLRAKNRHGTHSPFIYSFLDQTYYRQNRQGLHSSLWLLHAALRHFKAESAWASEPAEKLVKELQAEFPQLVWKGAPPADLCLFESPGNALLEWLEKPGNFNRRTVAYVGGLREPGGQVAWKKARSLPQVRVSLENFSAGLLFFRHGQAREHFRIRN